MALEGRGLPAYLGGRVPEDRSHPRLPPGWEARPQTGVDKKAPESPSALVSSIPLPFKILRLSAHLNRTVKSRERGLCYQ